MCLMLLGLSLFVALFGALAQQYGIVIEEDLRNHLYAFDRPILHIFITQYLLGIVLGAEDSSKLDVQGTSWSIYF